MFLYYFAELLSDVTTYKVSVTTYKAALACFVLEVKFCKTQDFLNLSEVC